jgi:hypothetical protein
LTAVIRTLNYRRFPDQERELLADLDAEAAVPHPDLPKPEYDTISRCCKTLFSSFTSRSDAGLIVVALDSSEELCRHEEGGLYSLTNKARILMGALWHETRNVATTMRVLVSSLAHHPDVGELPEVEGLSSLVKSLEKVAYAELQPSTAVSEETASVRLVLEHLEDRDRIFVPAAKYRPCLECSFRAASGHC